MGERETGFHRLDADWTSGREKALSDARAIARRQDGMARKVKFADPNAGLQMVQDTLKELTGGKDE